MIDDQDDPNDPYKPKAPGATTQQGAPPGVDGAPAATPPPPAFDRSGFRDAINGAPDAYGVLKQYGLQADKSGKVTLPTGEIMDVVKGAGAGGTTGQWMGVGEMGPGGQATYYAPGGGGAAGGAAGSFGGAGGSAFQSQIREQLMSLMGQANKPIDENSVDIAQPFAAAKLEASRGQDAERKALAEMLFAQGGGNVDEAQLQEGVKQSMERNAVGLGGIKAQLIGRALQNQMQKAQQALSLAVQSGDAESARTLQMQIAQMDSQLRRYGMDQQQSQFNDQFGLQAGRFQYDKDKDAALYGGG